MIATLDQVGEILFLLLVVYNTKVVRIKEYSKRRENQGIAVRNYTYALTHGKYPSGESDPWSFFPQYGKK